MNSAKSCPGKSSSRKIGRIIGIVITAAVLVFGVLLTVYGIRGMKKNNGYFENIPWGTEVDEVKEIIDKKFGVDSKIRGSGRNRIDTVLPEYEGISDTEIIAHFDNKDTHGLEEVGIVFGHADSELYEEILSRFEKRYGSSTAFEDGVCWKAKKSIIHMSYSNDLGGIINVAYIDPSSTDYRVTELKKALGE
ncbi:MAG: hypothetical protein IKS18_11190 [Lachnospiraceae bacterium]|nr:hypothetical protein [Lachnospiraceae bacterium]